MKLRTVNEICPDPSILPIAVDHEGWNSSHELFAQLINQVRPKVIVEVGSYKGASALHMASLTADLGTKIYCCDTWLGNVRLTEASRNDDTALPCQYGGSTLYFQFMRNIIAGGFGDRVYPVLHNSTTAARLLHFLGVRADLLYLDADHIYEQVYLDMEFCSNLIAPRGLMFGDDYRDFPGVRMAVNRFAFERGLTVEESGPAWVLHERNELKR